MEEVKDDGENIVDETNEETYLYGSTNPTAGLESSDEADKGETPSNVKDDSAPGNNMGNDMGEDEADPANDMEEDEDIAATEIGDPNDKIEEEETQQNKVSNDDSDDDEDEDDSDDDINVVIGDIKAAPSTYNIKQRQNLMAQPGQDKSKQTLQSGKFSIEDFEGVGTINNVAAHEFSIDSLEDKPWRKPGADITDYFNYGFNEETWRAYCERQKRFRLMESGVGLASLTQNLNQSAERHNEYSQNPGQAGAITSLGSSSLQSVASTNDNTQMPPPGMMPTHGMGVPSRIGMMGQGPRAMRPIMSTNTNSKENAIQVMTAECREYSRTNLGQMPPLNFGGPASAEEPFFPETDPFDYGYEPTQDSQWGNDNSGWVPTGIKELTPGPTPMNAPLPQMVGPPPHNVNPPQMSGPPPQMQMRGPPPMMGGMPPPNMGVGPPNHMMMGPIRMPPMGPPPRMMPPLHGPPIQMDRPEPFNKEQPTEQRATRSPSIRRNRSRSPQQQRSSRRRSKSRESRARRSRSKSHKARSQRRSRSTSKSRRGSGKSRARKSRSRSKSHKPHSQRRSRSVSKTRSLRARRTHSKSRSKSPSKASSSSKKVRSSEKTEK